MYRPLRDAGDARTAADRGAHAFRELEGLRAGLDAAADSPAPSSSDTVVHTSSRSSRTVLWTAERLEVRNLAVVRGGWIAPPLTLSAEPGEFIALVGPTGSGKTSLLRALLGLEREVQGSLRYGDRDLTRAGVGPLERPFAWVPQEAAIVSGTLQENIALGASETKVDAPSARTTLESLGAATLLARADGARLQAGGHELSGGERQWVALARALESGLPVLLLDEPTSGLDPLSQARVLAALATLRGKRTVILVTHRPEPLALAHRVIRLGET